MSAMRSCEDCLSAPQAREFRSGIARVAGRVREQAWLRACAPLPAS